MLNILKTVLRFNSKNIPWANILPHMAFEEGLRCWGNPGVCLQSETHDMSFATKALDSTIGCNPGKDPK